MIHFVENSGFEFLFDQGYEVLIFDSITQGKIQTIDFHPESGFNVNRIKCIQVNNALKKGVKNRERIIEMYSNYRKIVNFYNEKSFAINLVNSYKSIIVHHPIDTNIPDLQIPDLDTFYNDYAWYDENHNMFWNSENNIEHYYPKRRVAVIGDYISEARPIAHYFEEFDFEVVRISTDAPHHHVEADIQIIKDHFADLSFSILQNFKLIKMYKIFHNIRPVDFIFVCQNYITLDFSGLEHLPTYFYATRGVIPQIPMNVNLRGFFHAYCSAPDIYIRSHTYIMQHAQFTKLIPYSWFRDDWEDLISEVLDQDNKPHLYHRPNLLGFMGTVPPKIDPSLFEHRDYISLHVRDKRREIIEQLQTKISPYKLIVKSPKGMQEYKKFLKETKFVLNISAIFGFITERQYHAMLGGAILVQSRFKTLDDLGYKDLVNCILFDTVEELLEKVDKVNINYKLYRKIQLNGIQLALKNEFKTRVQEILKTITMYENEERHLL